MTTWAGHLVASPGSTSLKLLLYHADIPNRHSVVARSWALSISPRADLRERNGFAPDVQHHKYQAGTARKRGESHQTWAVGRSQTCAVVGVAEHAEAGFVVLSDVQMRAALPGQGRSVDKQLILPLILLT